MTKKGWLAYGTLHSIYSFYSINANSDYNRQEHGYSFSYWAYSIFGCGQDAWIFYKKYDRNEYRSQQEFPCCYKSYAYHRGVNRYMESIRYYHNICILWHETDYAADIPFSYLPFVLPT